MTMRTEPGGPAKTFQSRYTHSAAHYKKDGDGMDANMKPCDKCGGSGGFGVPGSFIGWTVCDKCNETGKIPR